MYIRPKCMQSSNPSMRCGCTKATHPTGWTVAGELACTSRYDCRITCTKDSSINIVLAVDNHLSPTLLADPSDTTWHIPLSCKREYHNNYNYGLIMLSTNNVKSLFLTSSPGLTTMWSRIVIQKLS